MSAGGAGAAAALERLMADPSTTGVFTDFDGTLSPIVEDPDTANPLDGATDALGAVARRFARVGVISGRPARFLRRHVGVEGVSLWGLHGLETVEGDEVVVMAGVEPWRAVVAAAAAAARTDLAGVAGVEDKTYALTLHFRRSPAAEQEVARWAERQAAATGLAVHGARMSYELRPPVPHGKDVILEGAARDLVTACFIGDDLGDAVAFDALDRLAAGDGLAAVRIAVASEEAPAELLSRADLVVDGPAGVVDLLWQLAGAGPGARPDAA
ncbi:MAG: trehalose-phosphatase [Acidimicrobiales bacterium]